MYYKLSGCLKVRWLFFGLATIFSSVLLAVMADISADLVELVAKSLFMSKTLLEFTTGEEVSGISQAATQQLGVGVMLSTLLITVPPMAGMWFHGVMGNGYGTNYFGGWNGGQPPPAGSGAGSGAHGSAYQSKDTIRSESVYPVNQTVLTEKLQGKTTDVITSGIHGAVTQPSSDNIANQQVRTHQQDLVMHDNSTLKNPIPKDRSE